MLRRDPAWGVNRVQRRMLTVLTLLLVLQKRSLVARRDRLRMFDWHVSRHKLVLVRIRTFIGLITCCQSAIGCLAPQSVFNPSCLITAQKCSIGAVPVARTVNGQGMLLRQIRHCVLRGRVRRWCRLTPCDVRTHIGGVEEDRGIARLGSRSRGRE